MNPATPAWAAVIVVRGWLLLFLMPAIVFAAEPETSGPEFPKVPAIALIIDDLGNNYDLGDQAVHLPGPVTCAFLPHGAHTRGLARAAHRLDKEVMLHLPMQSVQGRNLDPGALTLDMSEAAVRDTVFRNLEAVPYVSGINNHMGSLLTRHPGHMAWLMAAMEDHGELYFVDSRTTSHSVARRLALEFGVPNSQRDVFLDVKRDTKAIRAQFLVLVDKARRRGTALGIGHPYPETLAVLQDELQALDSYHISMVSVSELIELRQAIRGTWHASLSR